MYLKIAFLLGFLLDCILGDPHSFPHPVKAMGRLIGWLDRKLNKGDDRKMKGLLMVIIVLAVTGGVSYEIIYLAYKCHVILGVAVETIMIYQCLAAKQLRVESMNVYKALKTLGLNEGRKAVSMIVGRDTENLDEEGVIKAAVETVAENTSDGVIAPMIYIALGGPVLGMIYKAVNTMDSMVGYKNDKYLLFGFFPAKIDDIFNFIPSRFSALMMISACGSNFSFDKKNAYRIWKRDRLKHASPNSAQTESVTAGALHVQLAGDAVYFGKVHHKDTIGDPDRTVELEDIKRANDLMFATAVLSVIAMLGVMFLMGFITM